MANDFSIKINGLDELIRDAKKVGKDMSIKLKNAMVESTTGVQNDAKKVRPNSFKNQTGTLRRSIQKKVEGANRGIVYTDEKYAPYVEFGTKPHVITPKNRKMLAFKVNGKVIFAKKVNHPGTRAYNYMRDAFNENKQKIQNIYDRLSIRVVQELAGK